MPVASEPAKRLSGLLQLFLFAAALIVATAFGSTSRADVLESGNSVITGFSGTKKAKTAPGGDPLDETFIDLDGASMQIQKPGPKGPPDGQVITAPVTFKTKASEVGQVFAIALDDGDDSSDEESAPNIYLGATSAFGIQIVLPDSDGDGRPERVKNGHPNAEWMPGQFGPHGGPGSIWKVDGKSGTTSLFATIPGNTGAGMGDIVYDRATRQFFVSDLDTGLIHRLSGDGTPIDVFDHGETGRAAAELPVVADDGKGMDIKSAEFDALDSETWGLAPPERMVWGLGLHGGRLYYAVAEGPEIWSVGINLDGSFADDPRREIAVLGTPGNFPISDIAFDNQGAVYVAQRGGIRGSWDYLNFAEPKKSVVFRFKRELPDDPETPGTWIPIPDEYAVGFPPDYRNTSGGIALGYGYDELGQIFPGTCGQTVWTTGDDLRNSPDFAAELAAGGPASVHGLQGNDRTLIRPDNEPPAVAYFVDYDGTSEDPEKTGHVGDVEVLQPCADEGPGAELVYELPPLTGDTPPEPTPSESFNLAVQKVAQPEDCWTGGIGWQCGYTIRVTNTGTTAYFGDIGLTDWLPDPPPGTVMQLGPAPWACTMISRSEYQCLHPSVLLNPGESVDLFVTVESPADDPRCYVDNAARLEWAAGYGDSDPADDVAFATAAIPSAPCAAPPPEGAKSNLQIQKWRMRDSCAVRDDGYGCGYFVQVTNTGPGVFNGTIEIDETLSAGGTAIFSPPWSCTGSGSNYRCIHSGAVLNPGDSVVLTVAVIVPESIGQCELGNRASIVGPPGGSDLNTDASDDSAPAAITIPAAVCIGANTNLELEKSPNPTSCTVNGEGWTCAYDIKVTNRGPGLHDGAIQIEDSWGSVPTGWQQNLPFSWACNTTSPPSFSCTTPAVRLAPDDFVQEKVWIWIPARPDGPCALANTSSVLQPAPGSAQNFDPTDDKDDAIASFPPLTIGDQRFCPPTARALEERIAPLPPRKKPGEKEDEKSEKDDDEEDFVCPTGWTKTPTPGKCCPSGTSWDGERCKRGSSESDEPSETRPECWTGWETIEADETKAFIKKGYRIRPRREGNTTIWCARGGATPPPPPAPSSPPAPPPEEPLACWNGWFEIGGKDVKSYKRKGYEVSRRRKGKRHIWCAKQGEKPPPQQQTHTCWNGQRLPVGKSCPPQPPKTHTCWNGQRLPVGKSCPPQPPKTHTCWNGQTLPVGKPCPPRTHKCWNGQTLPVGTPCPPRTHRCWNGQTLPIGKPCPPRTHKCWNGQTLPVGTPCPPQTHRCWNGATLPITRPCPPRPTQPPACPAGQYFSPTVKRCVPFG